MLELRSLLGFSQICSNFRTFNNTGHLILINVDWSGFVVVWLTKSCPVEKTLTAWNKKVN